MTRKKTLAKVANVTVFTRSLAVDSSGSDDVIIVDDTAVETTSDVFIESIVVEVFMRFVVVELTEGDPSSLVRIDVDVVVVSLFAVVVTVVNGDVWLLSSSVVCDVIPVPGIVDDIDVVVLCGADSSVYDVSISVTSLVLS